MPEEPRSAENSEYDMKVNYFILFYFIHKNFVKNDRTVLDDILCGRSNWLARMVRESKLAWHFIDTCTGQLTIPTRARAGEGMMSAGGREIDEEEWFPEKATSYTCMGKGTNQMTRGWSCEPRAFESRRTFLLHTTNFRMLTRYFSCMALLRKPIGCSQPRLRPSCSPTVTLLLSVR